MASPLIYWVDRSLGKDIVTTALRAAGVNLKTYADLYPDDPRVEDHVWIPEVAARSWVILTKDKNIRRSPIEIEALRMANARYVCLSAGNMCCQAKALSFAAGDRTGSRARRQSPAAC